MTGSSDAEYRLRVAQGFLNEARQDRCQSISGLRRRGCGLSYDDRSSN
jgi:hypothetical protein